MAPAYEQVAMADNGGEYHFLSRLMHPAVGFLSAWSALIVGFSAPLAAIALAFGSYLKVLLPTADPRVAGGILIVALSLLNTWRVSATARFQDAFTLFKILLVVGFVGVGLSHASGIGSFR